MLDVRHYHEKGVSIVTEADYKEDGAGKSNHFAWFADVEKRHSLLAENL